MRRFVSSSAAAGFPGRAPLALAALLIAAPALAQAPASRTATAPETAPGSAPTANRSISATGRTMPLRGQPPADPSRPSPATEVEMLKAQKAAEARSKEWDSKMQKTMGSICHGC